MLFDPPPTPGANGGPIIDERSAVVGAGDMTGVQGGGECHLKPSLMCVSVSFRFTSIYNTSTFRLFRDTSSEYHGSTPQRVTNISAR